MRDCNFFSRSIKYENQNGEDGNGFWTPHSKEIFGWQTNNARGDTLIVNYVTTNPNDAKWSMNSIKLKHTSEDAVAHWSHLLGNRPQCKSYPDLVKHGCTEQVSSINDIMALGGGLSKIL